MKRAKAFVAGVALPQPLHVEVAMFELHGRLRVIPGESRCSFNVKKGRHEEEDFDGKYGKSQDKKR